MMGMDRRRWIAGAGAALVAPAAGAAEGKAVYDYLFLDLEAPKGVTPAAAYKEQVTARMAGITAAGGEVLGLFTPQIGWVSRQAALLVRWPDGAKAREREMLALMRGKAVRTAQRARLEPTLRPANADRPQPGGVYVHRWFVVEAGNVDEFLKLSGEGWPDFERRFDTKIFGMFKAERTAADIGPGLQRMLLITRYASHGVWEDSRNPSTDAMAAFRRRGELTRDTWAASTLLSPIA